MTKLNVTPAERDAILRTDYLSFAQAAFGELYPNEVFERNWHHDAIAALLVGSERQNTRAFINGPPRCLKSFLVSSVWPAFQLGRYPTHKFICASYSRELANHLAAECRRLMLSEFYRRLFPTRLAKLTEDELKTTEGGVRKATSVGATLTGLGGDTLIVDDPMNAGDTYRPSVRKSVSDWFTKSLMSRLNDKQGGAIFVVSQRLHQEDLTGRLIAMGGWNGLVLPWMAPKDTIIRVGDFSYVWPEGEPLQTTREGTTVLKEISCDPEAFAAQYMQNPEPETGNLLKIEWLKYYDLAPAVQNGDRFVFSIDCAQKGASTSDFSVCLIFLVRNNNQFNLVDLWRAKVEFTDLCEAIYELYKYYEPSATYIEDAALGSPLIDDLKKRGANGVIAIKPKKDKRTRIEGETPKLKAGSLILPKNAPWLEEFLHEYRVFPAGKHDDQIDALSQFLCKVTSTNSSQFSADWGDGGGGVGDTWSDAPLGAPSFEELASLLGRC